MTVEVNLDAMFDALFSDYPELCELFGSHSQGRHAQPQTGSRLFPTVLW